MRVKYKEGTRWGWEQGREYDILTSVKGRNLHVVRDGQFSLHYPTVEAFLTDFVIVAYRTVFNKIVFLDYDGVLNNPWYHVNVVEPLHRTKGKPAPRDYSDDFDPKRVARLKRICDRTGAVVVVTSSWRNDKDAQEYLTGQGIPIIGVTPEALCRGHRGDEIRYFLRDHIVDKYIILDDESSDYDGELMSHAIITRETSQSNLGDDFHIGLQKKHVRWAVAMLGEDDAHRIR